jgi:hypothetical protein
VALAHVRVALSVEDQRWHLNAREDPGKIGAHEHVVDGRSGARAYTEALTAGEPAPEGRLASATRREIVDKLAVSSDRLVALDVLLGNLGRQRERSLRCTQEAGEGVDEHKSGRPLRVRRCEEHHRQRHLRTGEKSRLLAPDRVQNRADVVHPRLHRRKSGGVDRVRGAPATKIAHDQAPTGHQAPQTARNDRIIPEKIDR